jgi:hypothetical protein
MFLNFNVRVCLPKHRRYPTTANETCRPRPHHDAQACCVHDGENDVWEKGGTKQVIKSSLEVPPELGENVGCESKSE